MTLIFFTVLKFLLGLFLRLDYVLANGRQRVLVQAFQATAGAGPTYNVARFIRTLSIDDQASAFADGHDQLNDRGAVSNQFDVAFDATPSQSGSITTVVATIPSGSGNFTIRAITLHDDTVANVTTSSTTLCMAIDGQTLAKTSDFSITFTITITGSDTS